MGVVFVSMLAAMQLECLALNIYFEARNQSYDGQLAVSHVVLNRVKHEKFPNNICDVVKEANYTSGGHLIRHKCQFSWYCDGLSDQPKELEVWKRSQKVARDAYALYINGYDLTEGSTHYHSNKVDPYWNKSMTHIARIDDHFFYKM